MKMLTLFYAQNRGGRVANGVVTVLAWFGVIALLFTGYKLGMSAKPKDEDWWPGALLIFWSLAPPLWFWAEYHWIWLPQNPSGTGSLDRFVHSQECSRNIWLALVAVLAVFYFGQSSPEKTVEDPTGTPVTIEQPAPQQP